MLYEVITGGAGTIMSYCHQQPGGYGNIAMTFGEGHTCGVLPDREAAQMTSHVVSRANAYPNCFSAPTRGRGAGRRPGTRTGTPRPTRRVITSYSIHYTKLYDATGSCRPADLDSDGAITRLDAAIFRDRFPGVSCPIPAS